MLYEALEDIDIPEVDDDGTPEPENGPDGKNKRKRKLLPISEKSKGRDMTGFEPRSESTWINKSDEEENFKLVPSAKTGVLKSLLLKGFEEAPMDKV
jgi:hypothetical protein